jgi:hypothetical protein
MSDVIQPLEPVTSDDRETQLTAREAAVAQREAAADAREKLHDEREASLKAREDALSSIVPSAVPNPPVAETSEPLEAVEEKNETAIPVTEGESEPKTEPAPVAVQKVEESAPIEPKPEESAPVSSEPASEIKSEESKVEESASAPIESAPVKEVKFQEPESAPIDDSKPVESTAAVEEPKVRTLTSSFDPETPAAENFYTINCIHKAMLTPHLSIVRGGCCIG